MRAAARSVDVIVAELVERIARVHDLQEGCSLVLDRIVDEGAFQRAVLLLATESGMRGAGWGIREAIFKELTDATTDAGATALGLAHGGEPSVLLTGDLALLHDANGFLSVPHLRGSLTIVLINNAGGGIFEHLPVAQFDPPFEAYWATPQSVDFARLCAAHGIEHVEVREWSQFVELISTLPEQGVRVLELKTDRKRDAALRKSLFAAAAKAAGAC